MNRHRCPVCERDEGEVFLRRDRVPGTQNLLAPTRAEATSVAAATLTMRVCRTCGFIWNAAFNPERVQYDQHYENSQTNSPVFDAYVEGRVRHLVEGRGVRKHQIVEVGCGNGSFLRRLVAAEGTDNRGIGYDPCYRGLRHDLDGRLEFRRQLLSGERLPETCDVIVSRHVIEHVPDPVSFLTAIRRSFGESPDARVYLETPCVEWILRKRSYWDLFHEHCTLFTAASLRTACGRAGLRVTHVEHVFGGQYLWLEARPDLHVDVEPSADGVIALTDMFGRAERNWVQQWKSRLRELSAAGHVAVWGAGAKGVTLVNLLDPDASLIRCVVDVNPLKQGGFIPGSGHRIVAPVALAAEDIKAVLLMNPNYRREVAAMLDDMEPAIPLMDISSTVTPTVPGLSAATS